MDVATVTLDEVLRASQARLASLVPETAGYLTLGIGDAAARLPFRVEDRAVKLTTEGSVIVERGKQVISAEDAAAVLRDILARLLSSAVGTMPGLTSASRVRSESARGMEAVVEELESALIPCNRAAARRALARLARETLRAKESGRLKRRGRRPRPDRMPSKRPRPEGLGAEPIREPRVGEPRVEPIREPRVQPARSFDGADDIHVDVQAFDEPAPPTRVEVRPAVVSATLRSEAEPMSLPEPTPTFFDDELPAVVAIEEAALPQRTEAASPIDPSVLDALPMSDATIVEAVATAQDLNPEIPPAPRAPGGLDVAAAMPQTPAEDLAVAALERALEVSRAERALGTSPSAPVATFSRPSRRRRGQAAIADAPKSDVEDLLRAFGESKLGGDDVRYVANELKSLVGLELSPAPAEVADHTVLMERPEGMERPVIDAAPLVIEPRRTGRVARAKLAVSMTLLVLGLVGTGLVWRFAPEIFAGRESPVVTAPPGAADEGADVSAPDPAHERAGQGSPSVGQEGLGQEGGHEGLGHESLGGSAPTRAAVDESGQSPRKRR